MGLKTDIDTDVLIVGAGPTGLTLAYELMRFGIRPRLIDAKSEPTQTSNALAVHSRTLDIWKRIGLLDEALIHGHKIEAMNLYSTQRRLARVCLTALPTRFPFLLSIPQSRTESILREKLHRLGVDVERDCTLTKLTQNDTHVKATIEKNGRTMNLNARWLIGCDGGHSQVRYSLGLEFEGEDFQEHFIMADVQVLSSLSSSEGHAFFSPDGPLALLPLSNSGFSRLIIEVSQDPELSNTHTPQLGDFKRLCAERCPLSLTLSKPQWTSAFRIHRRMSEHYQKGRVLLAGDSAHIHSPVGGQGMNLGIQDADNLAWKLAWTIHHSAKESLLASYEQERKPIAERVVAQTTQMTQLIALRPRWLQSLRNAGVSFLLKRPSFKYRFAEELAELNVHYRKSAIVSEACGPEATSAFKHGPQAGDYAPSGIVYTSEHTEIELSDALSSPCAHVLLFLGQTKQSNLTPELYKAIITIHQWLYANYPKQFCTHVLVAHRDQAIDRNTIESQLYDSNGHVHKIYGATQPCCYIIRPDHYIGFRSQPITLESIQHYVRK